MTRTGFALRGMLLPAVMVLCIACAPRAAAPRPVSGTLPEGLMNAQSVPAEKAVVQEQADMAPAPMRPPALGASESAPPEKRIVIKTVDMALVVEDPIRSMNDITRVAEDMGGYVVTSNRYQNRLESGEEVPQADITVRVPAERLNEALDTFKANAVKVQRENISGQDVTQEYTDQKSRLKNLEAAEADLRKIMDKAYSTEDVMNVYGQLTQIREQIEIVKGQIQYYEQSAALSAVSIQLIAEASIKQVTVGGWSPEGIVRDAIQGLINALKFLATVAIWLILFILPVVVVIGIPVYIVWALIRRIRRNRKARKAQGENISVSSPEQSKPAGEEKQQ